MALRREIHAKPCAQKNDKRIKSLKPEWASWPRLTSIPWRRRSPRPNSVCFPRYAPAPLRSCCSLSLRSPPPAPLAPPHLNPPPRARRCTPTVGPPLVSSGCSRRSSPRPTAPPAPLGVGRSRSRSTAARAPSPSRRPIGQTARSSPRTPTPSARCWRPSCSRFWTCPALRSCW